MFASITHIPSLHKILSNMPKHNDVPAMRLSVVPVLLPLLQQLQLCRPLLLAAGANELAPAAQPGSSSSSRDYPWPGEALYDACRYSVELLNKLTAQEQSQQFAGLLHDPAVHELQLQQVSVLSALLHHTHTAHLQQQQQQQRLPAGPHKVRADLLRIPAFHKDMLQLLPGGQAYLDAAAAAMARECREAVLQMQWQQTCAALNVLLASFVHSMPGDSTSQQQMDGRSPLLSAAAVRLMLELQLLAAGAMQRLRLDASRPSSSAVEATVQLLRNTCVLLRQQIRAGLQASGGSCLPPEVLQQAGLQLLQALAAPVQQLQLDSSSGDACVQQILLQQQACQSSCLLGGLPLREWHYQHPLVSKLVLTCACVYSNNALHVNNE
jgi:hypothetical protein